MPPASGAPTLTTSGVAATVGVLTLVGAGIDLMTTDGLHAIFALCLAAGAAYAAWRVRRADRLAALVTPPLAFALGVLLAAAVNGGGGMLGTGLAVFSSLSTGLPTLAGVKLLTALIVVSRTVRHPGHRTSPPLGRQRL